MFTASMQTPIATAADGGAPMMYAFPTPGGPSAEVPSLPAPTSAFGEGLRDGLCDLPEKDVYSRKEVLQARMQHSKQIHRLQASFEERLQKMHTFYQQQIESVQASAAARAGSPRVKYRQQRLPEGRQGRFSSHVMFMPPKFSGVMK